jgi:hypothetical protein
MTVSSRTRQLREPGLVNGDAVFWHLLYVK